MNNKLFLFLTEYSKNSINVFIAKPFLNTFLFLMLFPLCGFAQVGIGTTDIDFSAILEIKSTDKGVLFPSLTILERDALDAAAAASPNGVVPAGLLIYCEDCCQNGTGSPYYYNGTIWKSVDSNCIDVNAFPECLSMVTTITNLHHMNAYSPPLFIDGLLNGNTQTSWQFCEMHGEGDDEVNFDFNQTLPAGYKIQLFFYKGEGSSGISGDLKDGGSVHQTVSSDALPANATLASIPGGETLDFVLTITLLSDTDEVYVTANNKHPYLYEIKVFDSNDVEVPLTCP